jgi:hypothetical protein
MVVRRPRHQERLLLPARAWAGAAFGAAIRARGPQLQLLACALWEFHQADSDERPEAGAGRRRAGDTPARLRLRTKRDQEAPALGAGSFQVGCTMGKHVKASWSIIQ